MNVTIARRPNFISIGELFGIRYSVLLLFFQNSQMARAGKAAETAKHPLKHCTDTGIEQALENSLTTPSLFIIFPYINIWRFLMKSFLKVMKALSDANRVKIIKLLQQKMMCVCELQGALKIAQPTVSKHLKILEEAGLVDYVKDGLWVNYFLADGKASPYASSVLGNLKHWLEEDPEIAELVKKVPFLNREELCRK
jgi:ArsR family transcriptional regulator